mgnify:CR=1 FL=1
MIKVGVFTGLYPAIDFLEIDDKLETYYHLIKCDTIDITQILGCDVIVDDEGLLKDKARITYALTNGSRIKRSLVGVLIFAGHDDEGNTVSLDEYQIKTLKETKITRITDGFETWFMLLESDTRKISI